jgi:hypothetical protein
VRPCWPTAGLPISLSVVSICVALAGEPTCEVVPLPGPAWQITNGVIHRSVYLSGDGPHTAGLGPMAGPMLELESSEESLLRLEDGREVGGADFTWSAEEQSPVGEGGLAFVLEGVGKDVPLRVRLIYTVLPDKTYMHKQLALQATGDEPVLVRDVQVERAKVRLGTTDLGGLGQPVLLEIKGWREGEKGMVTAPAFWGLEYPASDNRQEDGLVTLEHHPGVRIGQDAWWHSKPAVFGFAEGGDPAAAFRQYLAAIRRPPRSCVVYNSWYDLRAGEMTVETLTDRARTIHEELTVKRGAPFDAVVLDDGWQDRQSISTRWASVLACRTRSRRSTAIWTPRGALRTGTRLRLRRASSACPGRGTTAPCGRSCGGIRPSTISTTSSTTSTPSPVPGRGTAICPRRRTAARPT